MSKILKPAPRMTLPEWADRFRVLSRESSSEPGPWETSRVEPARGPMLAITDPNVHTVVVQCSTQFFKTETINNTVGYFAHLDPCPMMLMQPTEKLAQAWSKDRLDKMVRDTSVLAPIFAAKKSRDGSNTILHKEFAGGHITMVGANTPSDLAMRPIRVLLCDEVDKYPESAGREGDPIKLASERTATFWNAKKIMVCSPTVEGRSRINSEYESSDKRVYEMPCPHCSLFQEVKWEQVKWEGDNPETAAIYCSGCGIAWTEVERLRAIKRGRWVATAPFNGKAGFKVGKLASPWEPVSRLVEKFLDSKASPEKMKVFVNTQLAETWREKGDAPEWERLYERRESYRIGDVPEGVKFLTAGVDVQGNRIEAEVVGWGKDKQSWSIQHYVFDGDTSSDGHGVPGEVWRKLDELLNETWHSKDGQAFQIRALAVDSGYNTQAVYNWARKHPMNRVIAVKGSDHLGVLMNSGTVVDVKRGRQRLTRSFKVYTLGVSILKTELYGWLRLPGTAVGGYPPGYCHFPEYPPEYFQQLTAEELVKKVVNGHAVYHWEKRRERNESLDLRIYARAAASFFGLDRFREHHWDQLDGQMSYPTPAVQPENEERTLPEVQKRPTIKRKRSTFL